MSYKPLPVPLYQRVFGVLCQRILDGAYAPGERLSTEEELAAEFNVSKATVRQAVSELVARSLVVRQQGRGTFVSVDSVGHPQPFVGSFADLIVGTKRLRLRDFKMERDFPLPPRLRKPLATDRTTCTVIHRRREIDQTVFAYTRQYLSAAIEDVVTEEELRKYGLLTLLNRHGFILTGADQTISAQLADVEVSERLEIELGAPVLYAERLLMGEHGPLEVVRAWYRGDLYQWHAFLDLEWDNDKLVISSRGVSDLA